MVCHRDPQMGADEIRRVGGHQQFVSVFTSFSGLFEPIGTARHDVMLDAMAEHDLVLTAHSEGWFPHFTPLWSGARTWIELFGNAPAGNCMDTTNNAFDFAEEMPATPEDLMSKPQP